MNVTEINARNFSLFADTPIARRADPVTSKLAAVDITRSGKRAAQQCAVHSWVRQYPGHTALELGELCLQHGGTMDRYVFGRRLSELAADHDRCGNRITPLVYPGLQKRRCKISGKQAIVWYCY